MPKTLELKVVMENIPSDTDIAPFGDEVRDTLAKEYADGVEVATSATNLAPKTITLKSAEIKVVMEKLPDEASAQAVVAEVRAILAAKQPEGVKVNVSLVESSQVEVDEVKAASKANGNGAKKAKAAA